MHTGIEQQYACRFGPGNASGVQRSTVRTCARTELRTTKKKFWSQKIKIIPPPLFIKEIKYIFVYTNKITIRPKFTLIMILVYNNIYLIFVFQKVYGGF